MSNGRTIYKRLMRNRCSTFWGRRAFVTVRFPLALIPEPPPAFVVPPGESDFAGLWSEVQPDGTILSTSISAISSGADPTETWEEGDPTPRFVTLDHGIYRWWEGTRRHLRDVDGKLELIERTELPDVYVASYIARERWTERYLEGFGGPIGVPTLDALLAAANYAKTTYHYLTEDRVYLTYSVKWFYRVQARRFAADLHRAFRVARKGGVNLLLCRAF